MKGDAFLFIISYSFYCLVSVFVLLLVVGIMIYIFKGIVFQCSVSCLFISIV